MMCLLYIIIWNMRFVKHHCEHSSSTCLKRVGREGVEPSRPFGQEILSLQCLPFHHRPRCGFHDSTMLERIRQSPFFLIRKLYDVGEHADGTCDDATCPICMLTNIVLS